MRSQALRLAKIWRLVSSSFFWIKPASSSKLMSRECVSGCFFNSSSLFCSSTIGFSKSSWCFIGISLAAFRLPGNADLLQQFIMDHIGPPGEGTRPTRERFCGNRSEEHTSELQSRQYLVCRLL